MPQPSTAPSPPPELVCPAGSLRALQAAVEAGADAVYLGLKDATNARNFAGLNFDDAQVRELSNVPKGGSDIACAVSVRTGQPAEIRTKSFGRMNPLISEDRFSFMTPTMRMSTPRRRRASTKCRVTTPLSSVPTRGQYAGA